MAATLAGREDRMNEHRSARSTRELIKGEILRKPSVTQRELATLMGRAPSTIHAAVHDLTESGEIAPSTCSCCGGVTWEVGANAL